jgi:hypothetical protein
VRAGGQGAERRRGYAISSSGRPAVSGKANSTSAGVTRLTTVTPSSSSCARGSSGNPACWGRLERTSDINASPLRAPPPRASLPVPSPPPPRGCRRSRRHSACCRPPGAPPKLSAMLRGRTLPVNQARGARGPAGSATMASSGARATADAATREHRIKVREARARGSAPIGTGRGARGSSGSLPDRAAWRPGGAGPRSAGTPRAQGLAGGASAPPGSVRAPGAAPPGRRGRVRGSAPECARNGRP